MTSGAAARADEVVGAVAVGVPVAIVEAGGGGGGCPHAEVRVHTTMPAAYSRAKRGLDVVVQLTETMEARVTNPGKKSPAALITGQGTATGSTVEG